ncbi:unnamed protein product [Lasius platythorax]|uniref:Uncharacterized protein n=1 Tax=Lasius platythorax TaxID=488582 RepID=A0AAV2N3T1_9HYME
MLDPSASSASSSFLIIWDSCICSSLLSNRLLCWCVTDFSLAVTFCNLFGILLRLASPSMLSMSYPFRSLVSSLFLCSVCFMRLLCWKGILAHPF